MAKKKKVNGGGRKLADELVAIGCELDVSQFRDKLLTLFHSHFPGWTDEQLLCRPRDSMHFCNLMRQMETCGDAPDDLILRSLVNARKAGLR